MVIEKYKKDQAIIFNKTVDGRYKRGDTGIVDEILPDDSYNIKSYGMIINSVPADDIINPYSEQLKKVDQILREKEKGKEFKDSDIRVGGSRKEMMAFKGLMTSSDLDDIEKDPITARKLINKNRVYPEVNIEEEKQNGVSSGSVLLKVKLREACGANPPDSAEARALYVGYIGQIINSLSFVKNEKNFREATKSLADNALRTMVVISNPAFEQEIDKQEEEMKNQVDKISEYERAKVSIFDQLKDKIGLFWQDEYKNNHLEGYNKELAEQYYYWSNLLRNVMRYRNYSVLPIEMEFAKTYSKRTLTTDHVDPRWLSREIIQQIFGVTFLNFLTVKSDAVLQKYNEANMYSAFTVEDYDQVYPVVVKPIEEKIEQYKIWILYLLDSSKSYIEKTSYAIDNIGMGDWWISGGSFGRKATLKDLIKRKEPNAVLDFINTMATNEKFGLPYKQQQLKNSLERQKQLYRIREDDFSWTQPKETKKTEKPASLKINSGVPLSFIKRVGGVAVFDNDLDSGDKVLSFYKNILGITGITYGQTLPDDERGAHAKHFSGSMLDLADLLNYDVKDLIGLGNLKIKFAASGHGNAMAHFEPDRKAINLSRKKGDGTVAHEMAHYFDKVIEDMFPHSRKRVKLHAPYASYFDSINVSNVEIYKAMLALMYFIKKGVPVSRSGELSVINDNRFENNGMVFPYLSKEINNELRPLLEDFVKEVTSKEITIEIEATGKQTIVTKYDNFEDAVAKTKEKYPHYFYYREFQENKSVKQYLQALLNTFKVEKYSFVFKNHPFRKADLVSKNTSTSFFINSDAMSSDYWTYDWELFARGFETFISYRQMKLQRENNYLVSGALFDRPEGVYPVGIERDILYILYDNLFNIIKKEVGIKDFIPFREERVNEYIVLGENDIESRKVITESPSTEIIVDPSTEIDMTEKLRKRWNLIASKLSKENVFEDGGDLENIDLISNVYEFSTHY